MLVSPFTSILDMARHLVGPIPFAKYVLQHNFDNELSLQRLFSLPFYSSALEYKQRRRVSQVEVALIHGTRDEIVPVAMGRTLAGQIAAVAKQRDSLFRFSFDEIPRATHNDIMGRAQHELFDALSRP